jgi:hypothetical protein
MAAAVCCDSLIPALLHATIDIGFTAKATKPALAGYPGMLITLWAPGCISSF